MEKRKFRTVFIGTGYICNMAHLPAIELIGDEYDVVACYDMREEAARTTAARFNIPKVYLDPQEMLDKEKPDICVVCTSNGSHKEYSLMGLRAGAHVICEKPACLTYADAVEVFAEAEKLGLNFYPSQTMRFFYDREAIKKIIDEGTLGDIYYASFNAVRRRGVPKWGFFHMKDYNVGGPFCDLGVHELDFLMYILGNPAIKTVSGSCWTKVANTPEELQISAEQSGALGGEGVTTRPYDWKEFSVEDMATGVLRFENDLTINFNTSWAVNLPENWTRQIAGTKAGLVYSADRTPILYGGSNGYQADVDLKIFNNQNYPSHISFPGHVGFYQNVANHLRGLEDRVIKPEETLNVSKIIEAFYTSAKTHKEVDCTKIG